MSNTNTPRLDDAALDADLSVLGDDRGEPSVSRIGSAPAPGADGSMEAADGETASVEAVRGEPRAADAIENGRASRESIEDVVEGYGKG